MQYKKIVVAFSFNDFTVYSSAWYCTNVVLVLDWSNVLHSIGMAEISLSICVFFPFQIKFLH